MRAELRPRPTRGAPGEVGSHRGVEVSSDSKCASGVRVQVTLSQTPEACCRATAAAHSSSILRGSNLGEGEGEVSVGDTVRVRCAAHPSSRLEVRSHRREGRRRRRGGSLGLGQGRGQAGSRSGRGRVVRGQGHQTWARRRRRGGEREHVVARARVGWGRELEVLRGGAQRRATWRGARLRVGVHCEVRCGRGGGRSRSGGRRARGYGRLWVILAEAPPAVVGVSSRLGPSPRR